MGEFIAYLKSTWGGNSRVSQRRRRLRHLVTMVRGVADAAEERLVVQSSALMSWLEMLRVEALRGQAVLDATTDPSAVVGSAKKFLAGIKTLFVRSAEVDRLTDAVEALESLTGPGASLDIFLKVLQLDAMDVAAAAASYVEQGSYCFATVPGLPVVGSKRKREAGSSSVDQAGYGHGHGHATSHGRIDRPGALYRHKRRVLACRRHRISSLPHNSNSSTCR